MTTTTMYLRVEPKLKDFFVKKAAAADRPLNYHVSEILSGMMERELAKKKVTKKKVIRRRKSEINSSK